MQRDGRSYRSFGQATLELSAQPEPVWKWILSHKDVRANLLEEEFLVVYTSVRQIRAIVDGCTHVYDLAKIIVQTKSTIKYRLRFPYSNFFSLTRVWVL